MRLAACGCERLATATAGSIAGGGGVISPSGARWRGEVRPSVPDAAENEPGYAPEAVTSTLAVVGASVEIFASAATRAAARAGAAVGGGAS